MERQKPEADVAMKECWVKMHPQWVLVGAPIHEEVPYGVKATGHNDNVSLLLDEQSEIEEEWLEEQ